ncbi:hypothetical protein Tco_0727756 [Tanacetum coccineum]|uniref:Uncharacterized protein n=1 Tax=Tanacetum coccineum TaxID=301880 RepID=A0ABQ4YLK6_9ASTR
MLTTMVPEQVKTMKIQAGIQGSRPEELRRHLQLWKCFGRLYYVVIILVRNIDQTINLNIDDFDHESNEDDKKKTKDNMKNANKRKRKPSGGIGNEKAKFYRADSVKNGTKDINLHYPKCGGNPMNEESLKQKKLALMKDNNRDGEGCSSETLQN